MTDSPHPGSGAPAPVVGIVMGILPGLSATLAIALLTTLTIKLQANDAILVLICSYVGALYGGSRTAILLNIPGTAANADEWADGNGMTGKPLGWMRLDSQVSGEYVEPGNIHRRDVAAAPPVPARAARGAVRARANAERRTAVVRR